MKVIPWQGRLLAIVLLLIAGIAFGHITGVTHESNRRDALELQQQRANASAFGKMLNSGRDHAAEAARWRRNARIYYRNWQERLSHEHDTNLAQCQPAGDVLLSGAFVGLYNAAWQPTEPAAGDTGGAAAEAFQAGVVTPRHVLENVRENADLCGEDRKHYEELIDLLTEIGAGK